MSAKEPTAVEPDVALDGRLSGALDNRCNLLPKLSPNTAIGRVPTALGPTRF
jgi:hypothetical protein